MFFHAFFCAEPPASPELRISSAHKYLQKSDSSKYISGFQAADDGDEGKIKSDG